MPRDGNGRAIIADPRNDENLIIVQFHKAVIQFHNKLVDYLRSQGMRPEWFEGARRPARWHYQWAVIHDFLPRFVGDGLVGPAGTVYKEVAGKPPVLNVRYYKPTNKDDRPFMPVEFVCQHRFAHSIIRPFYVVNQTSLDAAAYRFRPGRRVQPQRRAPDPVRPGHGVEQHPAHRTRHGSTAAQDRHEAVATADDPPWVRCSAPDPTRSGRSQHASRKARRSAVGAAGRASHARPCAVQLHARA